MHGKLVKIELGKRFFLSAFEVHKECTAKSPLFICFIYLFNFVLIQAFFSNEVMCGCKKCVLTPKLLLWDTPRACFEYLLAVPLIFYNIFSS